MAELVAKNEEAHRVEIIDYHKIKNSFPAVILIHGVWMTGIDLLPLKWRLQRAGFRVAIFHYHSVWHDLKTNLRALKKLIDRMPEAEVHCIGHSLGGLLLQLLFQEEEITKSGRLLALGSPFNGCYIAERGKKIPFVSFLQGRTIADLMKLKQNGWKGSRELGVIAGNVPLGTGRLLGRLPGANDGLILVEETKLAGAKDHCVMKANHTGLILSRKVSEQIVRFLRTGFFEHFI